MIFVKHEMIYIKR